MVYAYDDHLRPTGPTVTSSGPQRANTVGWNVTGRLDSLKHFVQSGTPWTPLSYYSGAADEPSWPSTTPHWVEQHGSGAALDSLRDSVQYDGWERVRSVVSFRNGAVTARDTFGFDRMGNIQTTAGAEVYNAVTNRLVSRTASTWTYSYYYDAAGNPDSMIATKAGVVVSWWYKWDALNRLREVRRNGTLLARYSYDVLGRRIAKRVYSTVTGADTAYTRFVYHGDHVAFEADSGGVGGIKIWKRYVWGMGTDDLIAVRDSTSGTAVHYYTVKDKLGSVRGLVKRDGTWQYSERFGPYGSQMEISGSDLGLRYKWTGREFDAETGFYYFRARYFEPGAKRFISEDPIGYAGASNLYAYVNGNVLERVDPSGLLSAMPSLNGFRSFCTASGSCLAADGSVTQGQEVYIDGVNVGRGGRALIADNGRQRVTITGNAAFQYTWESQVAVQRLHKSDAIAGDLMHCYRSSATCRNAITVLDNASYDTYLDFGDPKQIDPNALGAATGFYRSANWNPSTNGYFDNVRILIDPNAAGKWQGDFTLLIGHELGHAVLGGTMQASYFNMSIPMQELYTRTLDDIPIGLETGIKR